MESKPRTRRAYHHGDLHSALLAAAEKIVEEEGVQALTLRAAARAVGVSHTAPQNHFGDLTGLLSELAAVGFRRFTDSLAQAAEEGGRDERARNLAIGHAYVRFALRHRGLFALMFRSERLDSERPALRDAIEASRAALRRTALANEDCASPMEAAAARVARWSLVHGLAVLISEGRLDGLMRSFPAYVTTEEFVDAALRSSRIEVPDLEGGRHADGIGNDASPPTGEGRADGKLSRRDACPPDGFSLNASEAGSPKRYR